MTQMRAPTAMLVVMVIVFFGLYILALFMKNPTFDDRSAQNLFVTSAPGGAVEFVLNDDAIELEKNRFRIICDTTITDMVDSFPGSEGIKQMLGWRITDFNRKEFFAFIGDPNLWSEPMSQLTRAMRMKPYLGVNLILSMYDGMTSAEQRRTEVFFDNFARQLRVRGFTAMVTLTPKVINATDSAAVASVTVPEPPKTEGKKIVGVMNPDPSILSDMAIDEEGNAVEASSLNKPTVETPPSWSPAPVTPFIESLAFSADLVALSDFTDIKAVSALMKRVPESKRVVPERLILPGFPARSVAYFQPKELTFKPYERKSVQPPKPAPAPPLTDEEREAAGKLLAQIEDGNHLRINRQVFINRSAKQIEIPALMNLSSGVLEVLICDPEKGRVHESLLVSKAKPFDLQLALYLLDVRNGTPSESNNDASVRKGDPVEVFVFAEGMKDSVAIQDWLVAGPERRRLTNSEIIFVGSGFRNGVCLADKTGSLIDINSQDANTILWLTDRDADGATTYSARSEVMPRFIGDAFPVPSNEMGSAPVRPDIPKELEIPVTVIIRPKR